LEGLAAKLGELATPQSAEGGTVKAGAGCGAGWGGGGRFKTRSGRTFAVQCESWCCRWCLFSRPSAGGGAGRVMDVPEVLSIDIRNLVLAIRNLPAVDLRYAVTSRGPGVVPVPLPCPEFC